METDQTQLKPAKPPRKRRAATPRSPRKIDPNVAAIRAEAAAKVVEYHKAQASARILTTICNNLMPKMTDQDVENLSAAIAARKKHVELASRANAEAA